MKRPQPRPLKWEVIDYRGTGGLGRPRAGAWRCPSDRRLVVRHCGHPTALRPYYVVIDGVERVHDLGAFRLLPDAQMAALKHAPPR